MDSNSGKHPFYSDAHSKKTEQTTTTTPVKRPRQKQLQFDLVPMQQPSLNNNNTLSEFTPQIPNNCEDLSFSTPVTTSWFNDGGGGGLPPRRDTPVPEPQGVVQTQDVLWDEIQTLLGSPAAEQRPPTGLQSWTTKHTQRQLPAAQSFNRLDGVQGPGMMPMNYQLMNEATLSDLPMHPSFSASRSERARFLEMMNPHPPVFHPSPRPPPMGHLPLEATPNVFRKTPIPTPDRLVGEEEIYDEFPTVFDARDWSSGAGTATQGKTPVSPLGMDHRFRGPRRPRMPTGMRQEQNLNSFVTRQNGLFDVGYSDPTPERNPGRISIMRERLRRLDHRQSPLEESREPEFRATMERHRNRPSLRERRSPYRGSEFGALMSALGLVPDDVNPRETNSGISRMREAMVGIVNSRLPPHLLFSDRDFDGDDYEFLSRLDDSIESKKGADDQIINKIDLCSFNPEIRGAAVNLESASEPRCPICLEDFTSGAELRVMPCRHKYHRCCLDKWLKINAVCPICNMNIKEKFDEEQEHHN